MENFSSNKIRKVKSVPTDCRICGVPAIYSYFGVIACSACKVFFRRNARRELKALRCNFDGHCEIDINTRHACSYCRLEKCFQNGMQSELIRSSRFQPNKTNEIRKNTKNSTENISSDLVRLNEVTRFPIWNILQSNQSTFSTDQWNLLSNLSNCYDEHSGILIGERFLVEQNRLPSIMQFKSSSMIEFIRNILNDSRLLYENNRDFLSLTIDDRSFLLHNTFKHVASLSSSSIIHTVQIMDYPGYYNAVAIISHPSLVPIAKRIANRLDFDMIIMKLYLAILSFSTINYTIYSDTSPVNLLNIKEVLRIQNTYIELLWRYLLDKYDFKGAVRCLSELTRCFFIIHDGIVKIHNLQWFTNIIDSIVEQTELTFILEE